MAKDQDDWRRRREREDEEERERERERAEDASKKAKAGKGAGVVKEDAASQKLEEILERAETMIDQVHNLYRMFLVGVERIPPVERRKQLNQLMDTAALMGKATAAQRFRFSAIQSRYTAHTEQWDRMLKNLEAGKIKKTAKSGKE
jgi:ABC-type phosphate transport system auxiliary subunit